MTAGDPFPFVWGDVVDPPPGWAFAGNGANLGEDADRALGIELIPAASFGAQFLIHTGGSQVDLEVAFTGEKWYQASRHTLSYLDFEYSTNATSLSTGTWTQFDALDYQHTSPDLPLGDRSTDGNDPDFQEAKEGTISLTNVPDDSIVWIRWTGIPVPGSTGNLRHNGLSVDDFSITATVLGGPEPAPRILSITYDRGNNLITLTYQSINGEVMGVLGGTDPATLSDVLPDTPTGDGSVMNYTHNPPVGAPRYFYQLLRSDP